MTSAARFRTTAIGMPLAKNLSRTQNMQIDLNYLAPANLINSPIVDGNLACRNLLNALAGFRKCNKTSLMGVAVEGKYVCAP